jgi:hypothetical protein
LLSAFLDGINYRRGLDSRVLLKHARPGAPKERRFLSPAEKQQLFADVHARVAAIRRQLVPQGDAALCGWLDRILAWDSARLEAEHAAFHAIYKPVSILPPDQYRSVVLQATEGCSWNRCTFCTFYRDRPFRIKRPAEFREHIRQVKALLGDSIGLRTSLFLGDANALIIPQPRLLELLQVVHEAFPPTDTAASSDACAPPRGIYAFLDILGGEKKSLDDYRSLRALGVERVYIGLETGDPELFWLLNKAGSPAECVEVVQTIKAAGIDVGVILLAGVGGAAFAAQHVQHSLATVQAMPLERRDIVYLSPLVSSEGDAYSASMATVGAQPLDAAAISAQVDVLKAGLRRAAGPRVTLYHIEEFIY